MAAILSTNMASLYAQRSMATAQAELSGSVEKLSSGKRINSAKDDAAGLGISQSIAGISNINNQSVRNLQNATSLVQTADGALDVVGKMLQRILTLTTQKNDQALNANQRSSIDAEVTALTDEINRIRERTKFNSTGTIFGQTYTFGAGSGVTTTIEIPGLTITGLGLQTAPQTISASLITSNSGNSTFTIAGHGYSNGDQLVYYSGTGGPIGGLQSGTTYFVVNKTTDTFQLSTTRGGDPIPLTSLGAVGDDYFQKKYTINEIGFNNASTDVLVLSQIGWGVGGYVVFDNASNNNPSSYSPLSDGAVYQIRSNDRISITLNDLNGNPISFPANANLLGTSLSYQDTAWRFVNGAGINPDDDTFYRQNHGITDGKQLFYVADAGASVGGLTNKTIYYAIRIDDNYFKLSATSAGATGVTKSPINITSVSGSTQLEFANSVATNFSINPVLQSNTIQVDSVAGLSNGDQLIFRDATNSIGLNNGTTYYVINRSATDNTFQLSSTQGGSTPVNLTNNSSFSNATFERVSSTTFNSTSASVVSLSNDTLRSASDNGYLLGDALEYSLQGGSGNALSGLNPSTTYYAIPVNSRDFKLASSEANARAGIPLNLGNDGNGTDQFTKSSAITVASVNSAISANAANRATLGSYLSALSYAIDNLETMSNNLGDAYSRIVDTNFAAETATLTKNKILQEASAAMLAQANQMPNVVLSLLK